jgi:transcriptional regulator with XRE-family HTH domain
MEKKCQRCGAMYKVRPSHADGSKFCSRRCHDLGKTYKVRGTRMQDAIALREAEKLSIRDISDRLGIPYGTVAHYVRKHPLTKEERSAVLRRKLNAYHGKEWPRTNKALLARLGAIVCEYPGCTWSQTLEVHHVDGDKKNNARENLQVLCPNHHSVTPNFRNRRRSVEKPA